MPAKGSHHSDEAKQKLREARSRQIHPQLVARGITAEMVADAVANNLRWCSGKCKAFISRDKFYGQKDRNGWCGDCTKQYQYGVRGGWSPEKKAELAAYMVGYRADNEDSVRRLWLLKKYGVTPEWYAQKFIEQDRHCALCDAEVDGRKLAKWCRTPERRYLLVDHDHETGLARGLLCAKCNTALHRVEYIKDWATKALAYLARYSGVQLEETN